MKSGRSHDPADLTVGASCCSFLWMYPLCLLWTRGSMFAGGAELDTSIVITWADRDISISPDPRLRVERPYLCLSANGSCQDALFLIKTFTQQSQTWIDWASNEAPESKHSQMENYRLRINTQESNWPITVWEKAGAVTDPWIAAVD